MSRNILLLVLLSVLMSALVLTKMNTPLLFPPWPGILPSHPLYKVKVLRNKIIYRMIHNPTKKVEFDLLMADKTLYAAKLLFEKKEFSLAREIALKGENYFSILVSDYARARELGRMPDASFNNRIRRSYESHQKLFSYLTRNAVGEDKEVYDQVNYFSQTNFRLLSGMYDNK